MENGNRKTLYAAITQTHTPSLLDSRARFMLYFRRIHEINVLRLYVGRNFLSV
jgi:hypothetical protein